MPGHVDLFREFLGGEKVSEGPWMGISNDASRRVVEIKRPGENARTVASEKMKHVVCFGRLRLAVSLG